VKTIAKKADGAVWWLGWRPFITSSLFATAGILIGFVTGSFGPYAAGVGIFLVLLGLLRSWIRKTGALLATSAFVVFYALGTETTLTLLESAGLGTDWVEPTALFVTTIGTLAGAEATTRPVEVVGGSVSGLALWSLAGGVVGGLVWAVSVYRINSGYAQLYEDFVERVEETGEEILGDDGYFRSVSHGVETIPLVKAAKGYYTTNLLIGESSISLHHGSKLDMVNREFEVSDGTKEIFYDQVASVDYDEPYLRVRTSDGEVVRIISSEKPSEVIERVQKRLQRYKSSEDRGERRVERGEDMVGAGGSEEHEEVTPVEGGLGTTGGGEEETASEGDEEEVPEPAEVDDDGPEDFGEEIVEEVDDILDDFGGSESVEESDTVSDIMEGVGAGGGPGDAEDGSDSVEEGGGVGEGDGEEDTERNEGDAV